LKVEELGIPNWLVNSLTAKGITGLYPPQEEAVRKGLLEGRNLLVATPTASGKTLLAALAAAKHLQNRGKTVYLTPLRALTSEKRDFFDELFSPFGRVAAVSRDYDQPEDWLKAYDIIVSTNEKMDSMLRHKAEWISGVTLVVVDEVHLISYIGRGPTLEIVIARLREEVPNAQLLLLSATIKNVEEVASFAEAEPVTSSWRPVPLKEAVLQHDRDTLYYPDGSEERVPLLSGDPVGSIVLNTLSVGGQAMVFAGSRRQAETTAQTLSPLLKTIPKDFEALKRCMAAFLKGFVDSEGHVNKRGYIYMSNTDYELLTYVKDLLKRLGIESTGPWTNRQQGKIFYDPNAMKRYMHNNNEHYIYIKANSNMEFYEKIGFTISRKQKRLEKYIKKQQTRKH
jgi:helicase